MEQQADIIKIEDKQAPKDLYEQAIHKRNIIAVVSIVFLVAIEAALIGVLGWRMLTENFSERVVREFAIRSTGKLVFNSGTYIGDTDFGYFSGDGEFTFATGAVYIGEWDNNAINGIGVLNVPIEGTYDGEFSDSQKNGVGTFLWDDGSIYDGEWKNDEMTGQGEYTSADGVVYTGTFKENTFQQGNCVFVNYTGSYCLIYKNGEIDSASIEFEDGNQYIGECDVTSLSGVGTMSYTNGDQYVGSYQNGARNGQGIYTWESGDVYDGIWDNDCMSGTGTYTYADGSYASGTFVNNIFENGTYYLETSFGCYTFAITDGEATAVNMVLENGTTYNGDLTDGKLSGRAQIQYANGDSYDGQVSEGCKNGQGVYEWVSGASYDGHWADDVMSGNGTYYYSSSEDGYKLSGSFDNGKPDGECNYYTSSSEYYKTDWSAGKCVKIYE